MLLAVLPNGPQLKLKREEDLNYTKNIYLNNYFIVEKKDGLDMGMKGFSSVLFKQYVFSYVHNL